ncbi:MAG: cobalamin-independent methionine synthase II family protein, partial [Thermoleophilaceae bacterium]|nr:cobalamin-independent methionine synthase II family protein [Thermoleophilaceae bacterium]
MNGELPPFPVSVVGSLPRGPGALGALRDRERGRIDDDAFRAAGDEAVLSALALQEGSGVDIVSDGEQRRDNFYSFLAAGVDGIRLLTLSELLHWVEDKAAFERLLQALDVPAFAIRNPVVDGPLRRREPLAAEEVRFVRAHTDRPVKVALPGPYLLTRSMWVKALSEEHYPTKESLGDDVVALLRAELADAIEAGADFVQLDEPVLTEVAFAGPHETHSFMCAALSEKASPEEELEFAVELVNRVVEGFGHVRTGLHVCRGNWSRRDEVLLRGAYDPLVPYFARMRVDQLVLEYATERAGSLDALAELPPEVEIGLGVCDPRSAVVEDPADIVGRVRELLSHRSPEKVFLNPDCGFGTFAERPVNSTELAGA